MSSSSLLNSKFFNKLQVNRLLYNNIKTNINNYYPFEYKIEILFDYSSNQENKQLAEEFYYFSNLWNNAIYIKNNNYLLNDILTNNILVEDFYNKLEHDIENKRYLYKESIFVKEKEKDLFFKILQKTRPSFFSEQSGFLSVFPPGSNIANKTEEIIKSGGFTDGRKGLMWGEIEYELFKCINNVEMVIFYT